jgi:hypothetical protein
MLKRWMALLGAAALLSACAQLPGESPQPWNGGPWNSVLGYLGPYNVLDDGNRR